MISTKRIFTALAVAFGLPGTWTHALGEETANADTATTSTPAIDYALSLTTEMQWNISDKRCAWANLLTAGIGCRLWQGARAEATAIGTYHTRGDMADVYQDFSNINADNRAFRLVHFGLEQTFGDKWTLFVGLRQADADYFATPMASLLTGGITGCYPVVSCNFNMNAYPFTALGIHATYRPIAPLTIQASLYNGSAYDTFCRSFRFCPHADGVLSFGSVCCTLPATREGAIDATYLLGWNVGNHTEDATGKRHTQGGVWVTVEQPLPLYIGRACTAIGATYAHEARSPQQCKSYYNVMASVGNLTRGGGTLSMVFNRSYYHEGNESEVEVNFMLPIGKHLSLQPAVHHYSTNGNRRWVGQMRMTVEL